MMLLRPPGAWSFIPWSLRADLGWGGSVHDPSEVMCKTLGVCDVGRGCWGECPSFILYSQIGYWPRRVKNHCSTYSFYTKTSPHCLSLQPEGEARVRLACRGGLPSLGPAGEVRGP